MRTDILDLHRFYQSPLGEVAARFVGAHIRSAWTSTDRLRLAGFGYTEPYLTAFQDTERTIALAPAAQGVIRWPAQSPNRATLVEDHHWPLADASIDRLLIVHGLEEASHPRGLMREIWRVLADDGKAIIVVSHRRGFWSTVDTTPFGAGRPYLRGQLVRLLCDAMLEPTNFTSALFFPPSGARYILRASRAWERAGARLWPWLGGVLLIEAEKTMARVVARPLRARVHLPLPAQTLPASSTRTGASRHRQLPKAP